MSSTDFEPSADPSPSPSLLVEGAGGGGGPFEHPLTAATTAMLNINGATDGDAPGFNVFYDIYGKTAGNESALLKSDRDIWSPANVTQKLSNGTNHNGNINSEHAFGGASHPLQLSNGNKISSILRATPQQKLKLTTNHGTTDGGVIVVKEEIPHSPSSPSSRLNGILGVAATADEANYPAFATLNTSHYADYGSVVTSSPQTFAVRTTTAVVGGYVGDATYYRQYFGSEYDAANATRVISGYDGPAEAYRATIVSGPYKNPVTIDVNSPDSGIGAESITPRDHSTAQPGFDYNEMVNQGLIANSDGMSGASSNAGSATGRSTPASTPTQNQKSTRPWHEFGRTSETDKIQIPKLFLTYGFRYFLESPISTSQRREDDRITYINKGQFYGITLELVPDPDKPLKSTTVKSVVMLVFREEKSPEDEIKAWQFWHSRQHSVKQRILDADTKNSVGLVGCIDEVAHNAIAVYWNPLESSAKINVAVQCLSTDFSSQKGVKGLPLHLQIDTYDDPRDPNCPIYHRGYAQIKVFCDKGAERKTRDEERRAAKRKLTATGRKKLDELYHTPCDRTEFYSMSDLSKPPVLFSPAEDLDKVNLTPLAEFHGYYGGNSTEGAATGSDTSGVRHSSPSAPSSPTHHEQHHHHHNHQQQHPLVLKFHNNFPPDSPPPHHHHHHHHQAPVPSHSSIIVRNPQQGSNNPAVGNGNNKEGKLCLTKEDSGHPVIVEDLGPIPLKRLRTIPPPTERLMIFVRQEGEDIFTPVHLVPPTTLGLLAALEDKFKISMGSVKNLFRRNAKGVAAKVDDDMLKHYCHEDTFLLEVKPSENEDAFDVTLAEIFLAPNPEHNNGAIQ